MDCLKQKQGKLGPRVESMELVYFAFATQNTSITLSAAVSNSLSQRWPRWKWWTTYLKRHKKLNQRLPLNVLYQLSVDCRSFSSGGIIECPNYKVCYDHYQLTNWNKRHNLRELIDFLIQLFNYSVLVSLACTMSHISYSHLLIDNAHSTGFSLWIIIILRLGAVILIFLATIRLFNKYYFVPSGLTFIEILKSLLLKSGK